LTTTVKEPADLVMVPLPLTPLLATAFMVKAIGVGVADGAGVEAVPPPPPPQATSATADTRPRTDPLIARHLSARRNAGCR